MVAIGWETVAISSCAGVKIDKDLVMTCPNVDSPLLGSFGSSSAVRENDEKEINLLEGTFPEFIQHDKILLVPNRR